MGETLIRMRIGIDISQIVYDGTGVGRYMKGMVRTLVRLDKANDYILFGSSLRQRHKFHSFYKELSEKNKRVKLVALPFPPIILEIIWNRLHILPIEWFTGAIDVFWSSDWTQPPLVHAKGITTIHDMTPFLDPDSSDSKIVAVHKRRIKRAQEECSAFLCDSLATMRDVRTLLRIDSKKLFVVYPGLT